VVATVKRTTQVTLETNRVQTIRRLRSSRNWCRECAREVDVVGFEEASALTGLTQPELRECAETGTWHLSKSSEGSQLICLHSLTNSL